MFTSSSFVVNCAVPSLARDNLAELHMDDVYSMAIWSLDDLRRHVLRSQ